MTRTELSHKLERNIKLHYDYKLCTVDVFDWDMLDNIMYIRRAGKGSNDSFNDIIIMADTETSKKTLNNIAIVKGKKVTETVQNHVVAWTISMRAYETNLGTIYDTTPSGMIDCLTRIHEHLKGQKTIIYFHNLSYDYVFLRKFMFKKWGYPIKVLNTKPHYPISIEFACGLIFKDSLILAQKSLEKWAEDMDVEHKKSCGKWDYNKLRNQTNVMYSMDELEYIEHDTLAGVECLDKLMHNLNKHIYSMPMTATGIPREETRKRGKENRAHDRLTKMALTFEQYKFAEMVYHGGYSHSNRHLVGNILHALVKCRDFMSSYPFCMLAFKFPMEKFADIEERKPLEYILNNKDEYAFMFTLCMINPGLKNDNISMPSLQFSKSIKTVNAIQDNGRILCASYTETPMTETDLEVIVQQYDYDNAWCEHISFAKKDYLPRWFTDYIFECFKNKTTLKGGDAVQYAVAKAKVNSLYGMCVQKCIRKMIEEDFITGEYNVQQQDDAELYEKYLKNYNSVLPYQWGVWVTAYAFRNLFLLGKCCDTWVYSDTDSIYGIGWDEEKIEEYNEWCKDLIKKNGYDAVIFNGKEYWIGTAEDESHYTEFVTLGAKRYAGRSEEDGKLHITVAGVPKDDGALCLNDDLSNFKKGFIFDGKTTGKLMHTYKYVDDIYIDDAGNEVGDYIDLTECDYLLDTVTDIEWESLFEREVQIQTYE